MPEEDRHNPAEVVFTNPLTGENSASSLEAPLPQSQEADPVEDFSPDFVRQPVGKMTHLEQRAYRMAVVAAASEQDVASRWAESASKEYLSRSRPVEGTEQIKITDPFRPGAIRKGWDENSSASMRRLHESGIQPHFAEHSEQMLEQWRDATLVPLDRPLNAFEQEMLALAIEAEAASHEHELAGDQYVGMADRTLAQSLVNGLARRVWLGNAETERANRTLWRRAFGRLVDHSEYSEAA